MLSAQFLQCITIDYGLHLFVRHWLIAEAALWPLRCFVILRTPLSLCADAGLQIEFYVETIKTYESRTVMNANTYRACRQQHGLPNHQCGCNEQRSHKPRLAKCYRAAAALQQKFRTHLCFPRCVQIAHFALSLDRVSILKPLAIHRAPKWVPAHLQAWAKQQQVVPIRKSINHNPHEIS